MCLCLNDFTNAWVTVCSNDLAIVTSLLRVVYDIMVIKHIICVDSDNGFMFVQKRPPDNSFYVKTCNKNPKKTKWWYHGK